MCCATRMNFSVTTVSVLTLRGDVMTTLIVMMGPTKTRPSAVSGCCLSFYKNNNNNNNNTEIYNAHIVKHYAGIGGAGSCQVARRSVLIVNELGYKVRLLSGA